MSGRKRKVRPLLAVLFTLVAGLAALLYFDLPVDLIRPAIHMDVIEECAERYDIDPLLIAAMIRAESNFSIDARSHRGAIGLMQLMPATAHEAARELGYRDFRTADLERPEINIRIGTFYLHKLLREFDGNTVLALAAYNAGMATVERWHRQNPLLGWEAGDIPYRETRNYVKKITRTYAWLKRIQELKRLIRGKRKP